MTTHPALIIGYHNVAPTAFWRDHPDAGAKGLALQVGWFRRIGNLVSLGDVIAARTEGRPLPRRAIAITFDDGYRDNADVAAPMLDAMGVRATFFLVPGFLDGTVEAWWETAAWAVNDGTRPTATVRGRTMPSGDAMHPEVQGFMNDVKALTRAEREQAVEDLVEAFAPRGPRPTLFMDWEAARTLARTQNVGCHTEAHAILARETPEAQRDDLDGCRRRLRSELGVAAEALAYPNGQPGDMDAHTTAAVTAAGLTGAVTTIDGWVTADTDPLMMPRYVLDPASGWRGLKKLLRAPGVGRFLAGR